MKVAVLVLLVAVGACSAAFSGSLIEKTRPLLNQAGLRASIATSALSRSANKDLGEIAGTIQGVIDSVIAQAQAIIAQVQQSIQEHGQNLSLFVKAKLRAAIAAARLVLAQIAGSPTFQHLHGVLSGLIATLQGFLDNGRTDVVDVAAARGLLDQLNLHGLLQQILQNLGNSEFIQGLIAQFGEFLDGTDAQSLINQIIALILGDSQLSRAAPRNLQQLLQQIQAFFAAIYESAGDAIAGAHAAAQQLVDQLVAQGQTSAQQVIQDLLANLNNAPGFLSHLTQPLINALQGLLSALEN